MAELRLDTEFRYRAPWSVAPGVCRLRRFDSELGIFVVLTELPKNLGASVTSAVEHLILRASRVLELGIEDTVWIEHRVFSCSTGAVDQDFARVRLGAGGLPEWDPLPGDLVELILGPAFGQEGAGA